MLLSLPTNWKGHCLCKIQNFKKFSITLPILPFPVFYITRTFETLPLQTEYASWLLWYCAYGTGSKAAQTIRRGHKIMVHWITTSRTGGLRIRTQIKDIIERRETNWKRSLIICCYGTFQASLLYCDNLCGAILSQISVKYIKIFSIPSLNISVFITLKSKNRKEWDLMRLLKKIIILLLISWLLGNKATKDIQQKQYEYESRNISITETAEANYERQITV